MLLTQSVKTVVVLERGVRAMRLKLPKVLSPSKAKSIRKRLGARDFYEKEISDLTALALHASSATTQYPAYCEVQRQSGGHDWHTDRGNNDHMTWCTHTATVLLSPPSFYRGGGFFFDNSTEPEDSYLTMLIYSSDQNHRVLSHSGDRRVLLMFLNNTEKDE